MDIGALTNAAGTGTSSADSRTSISDTFDTFLTLLTTQLQYQDPIDPLNTDEFTNQLVQFSQVEQQIASNDKLDALLNQSGFNQISFAASLTGKAAEVLGSDLAFDGQTPIAYGYELPPGATSATLNIRDERGAIVYSTSAQTTTGRHPFTWDGQGLDGSASPAGTYSISVTGPDSAGNTIFASTSVVRLVTGVDLSGNAILVETADGSFDLNDILAIRDADSDA